MRYSLNWLLDELENKVQKDYLFFWGHTPKNEGVIDKSCFSQWYPSGFQVKGIKYPTAEHWMMAQKALLFNDNEIFDMILIAEKPSIAKDLGKKVKGFDAKVWANSCYEIVLQGNKHKFSQSEMIKDFLLYTGDKVIVEASPSDAVWGIGLSQNSNEAKNPLQWRGTNFLGFALMEVRDILK